VKYLLLILAFSCTIKVNSKNTKKAISETMESNLDKWTPLAPDVSVNGLYKYEDKDIICYMYMYLGAALQCFKK